MNKTTITILKTLAGTLAVTLLAVFAIYFMAGGVLFMPPFVVMSIYFVLFLLSAVAALSAQKSIVILSVVGGFVLGVFGFNALYSHTCGPNSADVKVMKPMAEKISAYIIKNGIPKSLKEIPDLPYGLVGCTVKRIYDYPEETCRILSSNRNIKIHFDHGESTIDKIHYSEVNLNMKNEATETGMHMQLSQKNNNVFMLEDKKFYSGKISGICNPMKQ